MSDASPKIDVKNKVVLITGAAQGIGLAIVKALLKNGARVSSACQHR
jgi:NAD(P)-dependent dehydrogenase (short-subunit alcohol dehydrogenase family)